MKQIQLILILLVSFPLLSSAQNRIIPVNMAIWQPYSIFACDSSTTTILSLGLPQTRQSNITGLSLNLLSSVTTGKMTGLAVNGLLSRNEKNVSGIVLSGLGNITKGKSRGMTASGYINLNFKASDGLQLAGVSNFNIGTMSGIQVSGVTNFAAGHLHGVQLSSAINITGSEVEGAQIGAIMNVSMENLHGLQLGFSNYARDVTGAQIGIINSAGRKVKGVQIGLINYAYEDASLKLGLINVSHHTHLQFLTYTSSSAFLNFAARFKEKHIYSQIGVGFPSYLSPKSFSGVLNYRTGLCFPIKRLTISGDLGYSYITLAEETDQMDNEKLFYSLQSRVSMEYQLLDKMSFFVCGGYEVISKFKKFHFFKNQPIVEFGVALF